MNTRPKKPANARNLNCRIIGSSGSDKTRFWLTPQLLQAHSPFVVVDPKGGVFGQVGAFLKRQGYRIKAFNSIDFSKSMHYNLLSYIRTEVDMIKNIEVREDDDTFKNAVDYMFMGLEKRNPNHFVVRQYKKYRNLLRQ